MNRNVKRRAREQEGAIAQAIDAVLDLLVELARLIGGHGRLVLFKIVQLSLQRIDILFDRAELLLDVLRRITGRDLFVESLIEIGLDLLATLLVGARQGFAAV